MDRHTDARNVGLWKSDSESRGDCTQLSDDRFTTDLQHVTVRRQRGISGWADEAIPADGNPWRDEITGARTRLPESSQGRFSRSATEPRPYDPFKTTYEDERGRQSDGYFTETARRRDTDLSGVRRLTWSDSAYYDKTELQEPTHIVKERSKQHIPAQMQYQNGHLDKPILATSSATAADYSSVRLRSSRTPGGNYEASTFDAGETYHDDRLWPAGDTNPAHSLTGEMKTQREPFMNDGPNRASSAPMTPKIASDRLETRSEDPFDVPLRVRRNHSPEPREMRPLWHAGAQNTLTSRIIDDTAGRTQGTAHSTFQDVAYFQTNRMNQDRTDGASRRLYGDNYDLTAARMLPARNSDSSSMHNDGRSDARRQRAVSPAFRRTAMKPDKFDAKRVPLNTFLIQFDTCSEYNGWSEREKIAQLRCCLTGDAAQVLWDNPNVHDLCFTGLVEKLKARYGTIGQREKYAAELRALRRKKNQSVTELYHEVKKLMVLAYPECGNSELFEVIACDHFLRSLDDTELEMKIRDKEPADLDAAFKTALRLEACIRGLDVEDRASRARRYRDEGHNNRQIKVDEANNYSRVKELEQQVSELQKQSRELRQQRDQFDKELGRLKCTVSDSKAAAVVNYRRSSQSGETEQTTSESRGPKCFRCGRHGHMARACRQPPQPRRDGSTPPEAKISQQDSMERETRHITDDDSLTPPGGTSGTYLKCRINSTWQKCLLDTGSEVSLVPATLADGLRREPTPHKLFAANGTAIAVLGRTTVPMYLGGKRLAVDAIITEHVVEMIIGITWLKEHRAKWDFSNNRIQIDGTIYEIHSKHEGSWCRRIIATDDVTIPPRSECLLMSNVVYRSLSEACLTEEDEWMTENNEPVRGLHVSHTLVPSGACHVPVRLMNSTVSPITLRARTVVADINPVRPVDANRVYNTAESYTEIIDDLIARVSPEVSESCREQLRSLLDRFKGTFSTGCNDLGSTSVVSHDIDTGEAKPIRQSLRRYPPAHLQAIRQHVTDMVEQGVIEPAQSAWASNIVLVKKKDNTLRCCIDYRQLNSVTQKVAYPLPRTDVCLDALAGARWFSTFDLRSSYHQVPVAPQDADKTAFICREGMYRFKKMPFGLCNAGATFQRLMDIILSGLTFEICLAYLDDIIVFSADEASHLERLQAVFR